MIKSDIHYRKVLRNKALTALYDHYFKNNGASIVINVSDLDSKTAEEKLAYMYLKEKKFIEVVEQGASLLEMRITADGIDACENLI